MPNVPDPLFPPSRTLLGPGPSDVAPSVLAALAKPTLGHLDPRFLEAMDEIRGMLRTVPHLVRVEEAGASSGEERS